MKNYDKLFKEKFSQEKREGSVYPSLSKPEVVYHNGVWVKFKHNGIQ